MPNETESATAQVTDKPERDWEDIAETLASALLYMINHAKFERDTALVNFETGERESPWKMPVDALHKYTGVPYIDWDALMIVKNYPRSQHGKLLEKLKADRAKSNATPNA